MTRRESRLLVERLNRDAARIAGRFGLQYRSITAERANVKRRYGVCYSDGSIKIRLRHVTTGRPLKYSSLVNTLCHELAHLRHFNHGPHFKAFYLELLGWARQSGIYKPGRPRAATQSPVDRRVALPPAQAIHPGQPDRAAQSGAWPPGSARGNPGSGGASPTPRKRRPAAAAAQLELFD